MSEHELVRLSEDVQLIPGPTNIGVLAGEDGAYLVDSGNDKEAGRKILKSLRSEGRELAAVINTHSNADHIGANRYLQEQTGCGVWATAGERGFIETPIVEASFLWGGYPVDELQSKFFKAKPSKVTRVITEGRLRLNRENDSFPGGADSGSTKAVTVAALPGHFFDMAGILTDCGVFFLGDSVFGEDILEKYRIPFLWDVAAAKGTLSTIRRAQARLWVPSHGNVVADIEALADANTRRIEEVEDSILSIIASPLTFEDIFAELCGEYRIELGCAQFALVGSTVKSFLSSLRAAGRADFAFENARMLWKSTGG